MIELDFTEDFNLFKTFECGQIFRFVSYDNGYTYYGPLSDRILKLTQKSPRKLIVNSNNTENLHEVVAKFLRIEDNYSEMLRNIEIDSMMQEVLMKSYGLRLLNQDIFECAISYLLSQCSNIPRIKKHLNQLAEVHGTKIEFDDHLFYLFPQSTDLSHLDENYYRELGFGYRAKYIDYFIKNYDSFLQCSCSDSDDFNCRLQEFPGIGKKVADCIQLFAFGDLNLFPIDVWINRFMINNYNQGKKASKKFLLDLAKNKFGKWAGYAQEMIFFYIRPQN